MSTCHHGRFIERHCEECQEESLKYLELVKSRPTKDAVEDWARRLMMSHGIDVVRWNDGSLGLLKVPSKYCGVLSDLCTALVVVASGEGLPKLLKRGKGRTL